MKFTTRLVSALLLVLVSYISLADLIHRPGHPVTFDGHIHMTTMNQFAQALYDGEFPVTWANNFANFGHPLPIIAHQLPAYLGAVLILVGASTEQAYLLLLSFAVIGAGFLFYLFFRKFADQTLAMTATILSIFFPYRALNIYTRGGLPELLASLFLPVLLLGVWCLKQKKYVTSVALLYLGVVGVALTHPLLLIVFFVPVLGYFLYSLYGVNKKLWKKICITAGTAVVLGVISASYYLVPLVVEIRYFYQSRLEHSVGSDTFLSIKQLFDPAWFYTFTHPGPRGNYIKLGTIEFVLIVSALILVLTVLVVQKYKLFKKYIKLVNEFIDVKKIKSLAFWSSLSLVLILLMLPLSKFLYSLPIVYQIQYPWRFLTALQITVPMVFIYFIHALKKIPKNIVLLGCIATILWFRVPQFYGKNYITQPESDYYFNHANLHSTNFNTVWSSSTEDYERKTVQAAIIEGEGELTTILEKNSSRKYTTKSDSQLRLIDYTFYFPGWKVYIDGSPIIIEYQDPNYRGLITYMVPAGSHEITVIYQYSQVRLFGLILTIAGVCSAVGLFLFFRPKYLKSD